MCAGRVTRSGRQHCGRRCRCRRVSQPGTDVHGRTSTPMRSHRTVLALALLSAVVSTSALSPPRSRTRRPSPRPRPSARARRRRHPARPDGRPTFVEVTAPPSSRPSRAPPGSGQRRCGGRRTDVRTGRRRPVPLPAVSLDALRRAACPRAARRASSPSWTAAPCAPRTRTSRAARCAATSGPTSRRGLGPCTDRVGHGTHVAGIVGGGRGQRQGHRRPRARDVDPAGPRARQHGAGGSIASRRASCTPRQGAKVINLSLGGPGVTARSTPRCSTPPAAVRSSSCPQATTARPATRSTTRPPRLGALSVASTDPCGRLVVLLVQRAERRPGCARQRHRVGVGRARSRVRAQVGHVDGPRRR
jgi:hypothetical protein